MKPNLRLVIACAGLGVLTALLHPGDLARGQEKAPDKAPADATRQSRPATGASAWTLDEALARLQLYPRDTYLQYVALQLARRENRFDDGARQVDQLVTGRGRFAGNERVADVDLFSVFTGALAVQESLQLDAMRGQPPGRAPRATPQDGMPEEPGQPRPDRAAQEKRQKEKGQKTPVKVADLTGPTVKSHPWKAMLGDKKPSISALARSVPDDFYFAEFNSVNKLLDTLEVNDLWGRHLLSQAAQEARTSLVGERLKAQLAMETDPLLRPAYDLAVDAIAVTGSDVFVREGSDVTLLFQLKIPDAFRARMDSYLDNARARPGAKGTEGEILGVPYTHVETPDRAVHVYSAYPSPVLHVRSNSRVALERVLAAIAGKDANGKAVRRLGDTLEFAYVRTLLPQASSEEDGLIYLSDPFIRRLMGPQLKLTERRRMLCYNDLRILGHAALLYRTQEGKAPESLDALAKAQCLPPGFGEGFMACPDGGKYSLAADGLTGVCSHHGHANSLTPCCEIPVAQVSGAEADEYKTFLDAYNQYWRVFFDPIALRVKMTRRSYRFETVVLPLIDNSVYTGLARTLGGKPEPLDALPVPRRNIFSVALRLNKEELLKDADLDHRQRNGLFGVFPGEADLQLPELLTKGLGNQVGLHVYDADPLFDFSLPSFLGFMMGSFNGRRASMDNTELLIGFVVASLNTPVYLSLPVRDPKIVDDFLARLDTLLAPLARQQDTGRGFLPIRSGFEFYRFSQDPEKGIRTCGVRLGPVKWRFNWARIGKGLYIASKPFILDDLLALEADGAKGNSQPANAGPEAHGMVRLRPRNWDRVLADYRLGWAESNRDACLNNLGPLADVARAVSAKATERDADVSKLAERFHGVHFYCPEGGHYAVANDGKEMACSIHGTALAPRQPRAPAEGTASAKLLKDFAGMTVTLTFLEDGLHAVVTMDRK
jgi:hypothetical protein